MRVNLIALIPAYNEETVIRKTLESVLRGAISPTDIYLMDDGSTDRTGEIARTYGIVVISNPENIGKARGVTRALEIIFVHRKDVTHVSFLDADTLIDPQYFTIVRSRLNVDLKEWEKVQKSKRSHSLPIAVLCGNPKSIRHNWLTAYRAYQYFLSDVIHKPGQSKLKSITVAPGCASTYSVEILKKIQWQDDTRAEDMDATIQVALLGAKIIYEKRAVVYTQDPANLKDYIGQVGGRWYTGAWQIMNKYGLLWKGYTAIHWECRISMILESMVLLVSFWYGYHHPVNFLKGVLISLLFTFTLALVASIKENRPDIVLFCPLYPLMFLLDFSLCMKTSIHLFIGPKSRKPWYKVERYELPSIK